MPDPLNVKGALGKVAGIGSASPLGIATEGIARLGDAARGVYTRLTGGDRAARDTQPPMRRGKRPVSRPVARGRR